MRLAVTGAFGSGKTTLVTALAAAMNHSVPPVAAMQGPRGRPRVSAVDSTREELMELLVRRLMDRATVEFARPRVISDGSLIHDWVFVRTMLMHGARPEAKVVADPQWCIEALEPSRRAIHSRLKGLYDVVVHLPIQFRLDPSRPHPVNEKFRALSDEYLLAELRDSACPIVTVVGDVDERVSTCLEAMNHHITQGAPS